MGWSVSVPCSLADPIAWIDITLIVNDEYMTLIYRFLGHPALRTAASETLANIVSKKMSSGDKLEMITFLNLTQVVNSLDADQDVEFAEAMARLVNAQGLELTRILLEVRVPNLHSTIVLIILGKLFPNSRIENCGNVARIASPTTPVSFKRIRRYQHGGLPILNRSTFSGTHRSQFIVC